MKNAGVVLQTLFDEFTERLDGRDNFELPARRYIHAGEIAHDCPQFVIVLDRIYPGFPGAGTTGYQSESAGITAFSADIGIELARAAPNFDGRGAPPKPDVLLAAVTTMTDDAKALTDTLFAIINDGTVGHCDELTFGGLSWIGPEGNLQTTVMTVSTLL